MWQKQEGRKSTWAAPGRRSSARVPASSAKADCSGAAQRAEQGLWRRPAVHAVACPAYTDHGRRRVGAGHTQVAGQGGALSGVHTAGPPGLGSRRTRQDAVRLSRHALGTRRSGRGLQPASDCPCTPHIEVLYKRLRLGGLQVHTPCEVGRLQVGAPEGCKRHGCGWRAEGTQQRRRLCGPQKGQLPHANAQRCVCRQRWQQQWHSRGSSGGLGSMRVRRQRQKQRPCLLKEGRLALPQPARIYKHATPLQVG